MAMHGMHSQVGSVKDASAGCMRQRMPIRFCHAYVCVKLPNIGVTGFTAVALWSNTVVAAVIGCWYALLGCKLCCVVVQMYSLFQLDAQLLVLLDCWLGVALAQVV